MNGHDVCKVAIVVRVIIVCLRSSNFKFSARMNYFIT